MKIKSKLRTTDNSSALLTGLRGLPGMKVFVGVPESTATRAKSDPINNAQLTYIHTHGSPLRNIPSRPIIEPAINARGNREPIQEELKLAAAAQLANDAAKATEHLRRAGLIAQSAVRAWFTDPRNGWAPNAPATIRRKGSDRPLIDRAELRKAMTFAVVPSK